MKTGVTDLYNVTFHLPTKENSSHSTNSHVRTLDLQPQWDCLNKVKAGCFIQCSTTTSKQFD